MPLCPTSVFSWFENKKGVHFKKLGGETITKIALTSDVHVDLVPNNYLKTIRDATKLDVDAYFILGDISNTKDKTIRWVNRFCEAVQKPVVVIPGNHDLWAFGSVDEFNKALEHIPNIILPSKHKTISCFDILGLRVMAQPLAYTPWDPNLTSSMHDSKDHLFFNVSDFVMDINETRIVSLLLEDESADISISHMSPSPFLDPEYTDNNCMHHNQNIMHFAKKTNCKALFFGHTHGNVHAMAKKMLVVGVESVNSKYDVNTNSFYVWEKK